MALLEQLLDRLATYKEKILAIKGKIKSALFYPISIIVVALVVTAVIMIFVIPVFKDLFKSFGADLPGPTLVVMAISDWFLASWWWLFPGIFGGIWFFFYMWRRSVTMQRIIDRMILRVPVFGDVIRKASIARWCRTLSTMFAAGVPLVASRTGGIPELVEEGMLLPVQVKGWRETAYLDPEARPDARHQVDVRLVLLRRIQRERRRHRQYHRQCDG